MGQDEKRIPLRKGTKIGDFNIEKTIGYGGSSLCYLAVSRDRSVIIKEVYPKSLEAYLARNPKNQALEFVNDTLYQTFEAEYKAACDRQRREGEIANSLRDPYNSNNSYFFSCYSLLCQENQTEYLVVDTEGGQTLHEIMSHRTLSGLIEGFEAIDDILEITKRILEAIKPIHDINKIHCDLSPDNIFVSNTKQDNKNGRRNVKAIDFNSTYTQGENLTDFSFSKKEGYSALELMVKSLNHQIDFGTDLYSVAAILFNLLYNELFIYDKFTDDVIEDKLTINIDSAYMAQLNIPAQNKLMELFHRAFILRYESSKLSTAIDSMINDINEIQRIQSNIAGYSRERLWNMSNTLFNKSYNSLHYDEIAAAIIPELELQNQSDFSYKSSLEMLEKHPQNKLFFIQGERGGAGKTTHLMELWKYFIRNYSTSSLVPIYIPLYEVSNKMMNRPYRDEYTIRRFIAEKYAGILQDFTSEENQLNGLNTLFEQGRYLLLFDGLNEIKQSTAALLYHEIELLSNFKDLVIVLTSRFVPNNSFFHLEQFIKLKLRDINSGAMKSYIGEDQYLKITKNKKLQEVLSNPMMLSIYKAITLEYSDTYIYSEQLFKPNNLFTVGELLELYLRCHLYKSKKQQCSDRVDKNLKLILEVYLPQLAYEMYKGDTLSINEADADELFSNTNQDLVKDIYEVGQIYNFISIHEDYETSYFQMHQLMRDFLVAKHLKNLLESIIKKGFQGPHKEFNETVYPRDILKLFGEVCHDYANTPYINEGTKRWSASFIENQENPALLNSLLNLCRNIYSKDMKYEVLNIINTMILMRQNDLSGMDMSYLNLSNINLKSIRWSRNYNSNYLSSSFIGAVFTDNNWLPHKSATITSAVILDTNTNYFITGTREGIVELWDTYSELCISSLKLTDTALTSIICQGDKLLVLSEDNKIWSVQLELDGIPLKDFTLLHDLSNSPPIYKIEYSSHNNSIIYYTFAAPTTKHFMDGSVEVKERDYSASAVAFNKKTGTWLRNTIFENNIILEEAPDCTPISNFKGHRELLGSMVRAISFDSTYTKFVSVTSNELIIWDYKSHEMLSCLHFPGKNMKGAIFMPNDQLLVYGDELFTFDLEGNIRSFSSFSSQRIISVALNPINNTDFHHYLYVLCDRSIKVLNIDNNFRCEGIIDVQLSNTIYKSHEIQFIQNEVTGLPDPSNIALVSNTGNSVEVRRFDLNTSYYDNSEFDPRFNRLTPSNKVLISKTPEHNGCFIRLLEDRILFNNNDTGLLISEIKIPHELKVQNCCFSNNLSRELKEQLHMNSALWE